MVLNQTESVSLNAFAEDRTLPLVVVQGLGFVGTAMVAALVSAKNHDNTPCFNVMGVDLDTKFGRQKIDKINQAQPAIISSDKNIESAIKQGWLDGRLMATSSKQAYELADIVVVDINLDVQKSYGSGELNYDVDLSTYKKAITDIASRIKEDALVIIESTVPPGMTEKVIYPIFKSCFENRCLNIENFSLVHSYERVMPGVNYLRSITNYYRVFSGISSLASKKARAFFEKFINVKEFPLTELASPRASELSKVLENSYRAMNIAFIQEWTEFAEEAGVDLFSVLQAIKKRHTHNNIMAPGFGVGGYCLTKDSLLADWAKMNLFESNSHLEKSIAAIQTNDRMPLYTVHLLKKAVGSLAGKKIALLGVSYLNDVADTRSSPAEVFYDACIEEGADVFLHDSFVSFWPEKDIAVENDLRIVKSYNPDIITFAVRHSEYLNLNSIEIFDLFSSAEIIIDANNIISDEKSNYLKEKGISVLGVGKGHWN